VHLHARNPADGRPTPDAAVFMGFLPKIKRRSDVVINVTTGGSLATVVHFPFYAAMPLTGWMVISAHPPTGPSGQHWKFTTGAAQAKAGGTRSCL
jgi:hypothetical protein